MNLLIKTFSHPVGGYFCLLSIALTILVLNIIFRFPFLPL